jgi:hypothetical protein
MDRSGWLFVVGVGLAIILAKERATRLRRWRGVTFVIQGAGGAFSVRRSIANWIWNLPTEFWAWCLLMSLLTVMVYS